MAHNPVTAIITMTLRQLEATAGVALTAGGTTDIDRASTSPNDPDTEPEP